jgi:tetratricopeptide (TPR) repeat protein
MSPPASSKPEPAATGDALQTGVALDCDWQAGVRALREGRLEDAIDILQREAEKRPDSFEGHNFLGVALAQAKRLDESIASLRTAIELCPGSAQAHYNLGLALLADEQPAAARAEFERALNLDSSHTQAARALSHLPALQPELPPEEAPPLPASLPATISAPVYSQPFTHEAGSHDAEPTAVVESPPRGATPSFARSLLYGGGAALAGAFAWDKVTFFTGYQIDLFAVGIGILVGLAAARGAGNRPAAPIRASAVLLAALGILLGQLLIIMSYVRALPPGQSRGLTESATDLAFFALSSAPGALTNDAIRLLFVVIALCLAWVSAGSREADAADDPVEVAPPPLSRPSMADQTPIAEG